MVNKNSFFAVSVDKVAGLVKGALIPSE